MQEVIKPKQSITKRKALFVFNIIVAIIAIFALVVNVIVIVGVVQSKNKPVQAPEVESTGDFKKDFASQLVQGLAQGVGKGGELVALLLIQILILIPLYIPCIIVSIVSAVKKYFNWLSIANMSFSVLAIILTITMFIVL